MAERKEKLNKWKERLARAERAYDEERQRMDQRERQYLGNNKIKPLVQGKQLNKTPHVRNITAELVEAQVDSSIPQPRVQAKREQDRLKAVLIENMLMNEIDRMPMEEIVDMMERTVLIQGGAGFLLEWDNTAKSHGSSGELYVSYVHSKQIVPQPGVFSGIEDMDYCFIKLPQTKGYIERRYGVILEEAEEEEPEIRGRDGETGESDLVTQYFAYYRNRHGGIGLFSWVNDTVLEDLENYQARRLKRCTNCGAPEPQSGAEEWDSPGEKNDDVYGRSGKESRGKTCPHCGGTSWKMENEDYEEIVSPIPLSDGRTIPPYGVETIISEDGQVVTVSRPTRIPCYRPDVYPLILRKNISVYGRFLGESDVDKIADQQNTINRLYAKIIDKIDTAGSIITLPPKLDIATNPDDMRVVHVEGAADLAMIKVFNLEGDISQDMVVLREVYEEARQALGITDTWQGRRDPTAESGKAKEISVAQSAGRMSSKREMKEAAFAYLYKAMFKFLLAYRDEPFTVISKDEQGNDSYTIFNKYDFLEQDEAGKWYWNDNFLFSCDSSTPLAKSREAMWQETRANLQTGTYGDPTSPETMAFFWGQMEQLGYPNAGDAKRHMEELLQKQQAQQQLLAFGRAQQGDPMQMAGAVVPPPEGQGLI